MNPRDDGEAKRDDDREMGVGVQIMLGFFLVAAFCGLIWSLFGAV